MSGDSPLILYVFGTFLVTTVEYWLLAGLYFLVDMKGWFHSLQRYRIPRKAPDYSQSLLIIRNVLVNQSLVSIPCGYLTFLLAQLRGHMPVRELPSLSRLAVDLLLLMACEEIGFYYVHRTLHRPFFYKRFHRVHHEWQSPVAMAAIYCHPVEHVFCNLLPIFGGLVLLGSHVVTCWLWIAAVNFVVLNDHSGYHFPFLLSSEAHDYHHRRYVRSVEGSTEWQDN